MKKINVLAVLFHFALTLSAQTNYSYESWNNFLGMEVPEGWSTLNLLALSGSDSLSCVKTKDAAHGNYAAKVRPVVADVGSPMTFRGLLSQASPYKQRPLSFRFDYKLTGVVSTDTTLAAVSFYKGSYRNPANIIGQAEIVLSQTLNWKSVEVPIIWTDTSAPDTAVTGFVTSENLNSWLFVDNVSLSIYGVGTNSAESSSYDIIQKGGKLIIPEKFAMSSRVIIYSTDGKMLGQYHAANCDVSQLPPGIYSVSVISEGGVMLLSRKFYKE